MNELTDEAFLAAFDAGEQPGGVFRHADHVRLAWIVLRRDGAALGEERIAAGIRGFAEAQGAAGLYHDTLTRAWVRIVASALDGSRSSMTFEKFLASNPQLGDKGYLFQFYSPETLSTPLSRRRWVDPDLQPLPRSRAAVAAERRTPLLRRAFFLGAVTDALAVIPMLVPSIAQLLWGVDEASGPYRFAMGYAASLMAAWTGLLLWAYRRPAERDFVAALTVFVIYGLIATEIVAVMSGHMAAWRMVPTWILQAGLLALFASAYHYPALPPFRVGTR